MRTERMTDADVRQAAEMIERDAVGRSTETPEQFRVLMVARAYLARPPLTRQRIEAAVRKLFDAGEAGDCQLCLLLGGYGGKYLGGFDERSLTDRLCRLLDVKP